MNLKKFALKGLIILAVFVALCMFFSGTIKTISTAKVKLTSAKNGKLEENIELAGKITFPDVEKVTLDVDAGQTLIIEQVDTRAGYTIQAGDVLIEASVTNYDATMNEYQTGYNTAMEQLMDLNSKNSNLRIRKSDEIYTDAYYALKDANQGLLTKQVDMEALLDKQGLKLPEEGYPEGADETLSAAIDAYRQAVQALDTAQKNFDDVSRYKVDETTWTYITQKKTLEDSLADFESKIKALTSLQARVEQIKAPRDGYVAELNVKDGDTYDGSVWAYSMTKEDSLPVLRADLSDVERTISKGADVNITTTRYGTLQTKVVNVGSTVDGLKYADVEITQEMQDALGSVYSLSQADTPMTIVYKAKDSTCLVPSSAVRGSGSDRYVLTVNKTENAFGSVSMKVSKMAVTVLAEVGGVTSVQEDISYYTLAYMEDREIKDGDSVMEYTD